MLLIGLWSPQSDAASKFTAQDRTDIQRIEAYLNKFKSLRSNFVQVASGKEADSAEAAEGRSHLAPQRGTAAVRAAVSAAIPLAPPAQGGLRRAGAEVVGS